MASVKVRLEALKQASVAELIAALEDPSSVVVEAAAKRIEQPRGTGPLLRAYLRLDAAAPAGDSGCWGRIAILEALGRMGAPEGEEAARRGVKTVQVERVSGGLVDTATGLRLASAGVLANLSAPGALIDLAILLFDMAPNTPGEDPFVKMAVRVAAARAMGALGDPGGSALLATKLAFPAGEMSEVLAECMDALAALQEPRAVELLSPWLTHADPYLAAVAATNVARCGKVAALPVLLEALPRVAAEARESLVLAIGSIRADEAREALRRLVEHDDPVIRRTAEGLV